MSRYPDSSHSPPASSKKTERSASKDDTQPFIMKEKRQKTDKSPKKDVNEGYWMPEEDRILLEYIQKHGPGRWKWLPKRAGLRRCGRSCRMRWLNYLRPDIKRGPFTLEEVDTIIHLQSIHGNRWTVIASQLPGRTDNDIKNYWKTHLQKRLLNKNSDQANCDPPSPSGLDPTCDSPPSHSILPMVEFKEKHSPPSCSGEDPTDHEPTSHSPPAVIESNKNKDPPSTSGLNPTNHRPRSHLVPNPTNHEQVSESPIAVVESAENDLLALWNSEVGESFRKFYYGLKEHFQRLNKTNKGEVVTTSSSSHPAHVSFVINGDGSCPKQ